MKIQTVSISFILGLFTLGTIIVLISSISLSKTSQIQEIWLEFEEHRNDRHRALIALRSELGYGGMIHRFKNYILRQNEIDFKALISSTGGAKVALKQYKSLQLSTTERHSIVQIEKTIDNYQSALNHAKALIKEKKSAKQIDQIVKVNDSYALEALKFLEKETQNTQTEHQSRPMLLSLLRSAMGYGGLIHNFKNYILRHSPEAKAHISFQIDIIKELSTKYKQHKLSIIEQKALSDILSVVASYQKQVPIIQQMGEEGESPRTIDKAVIIDDTPAFKGFNTLQQEITINNELRAKQLNIALLIVQKTGNIIFYISLVSF